MVTLVKVANGQILEKDSYIAQKHNKNPVKHLRWKNWVLNKYDKPRIPKNFEIRNPIYKQFFSSKYKNATPKINNKSKQSIY